MLVLGTFDWRSTLATGQFHCPNCGSHQVYRRRSSRTFLTVYFIPMLPIGRRVEFVECTQCRSCFGPESLLYIEGKAAGAIHVPSFKADLITGLAAIMCDDGHVEETEIAAAQRAFARFTGEELTRELLGKQCGVVRQMRLGSLGFVHMGRGRWSRPQQTQMLQALFVVASATGHLTARRHQTLLACQRLFALSEPEYEEIINGAIEAFG